MNIIYTFMIAMSLSMDAFSLSLSLGAFGISKNDHRKLSLFIGIFHLLFPIMGSYLGRLLFSLLNININLFLGIIFIFIGLGMALDFFDKKDKVIIFNLFGLIICAFTVSIDSFTVGLTLQKYVIISSIIFSLFAYIISKMGFILGNKISESYGTLAKIVGIILILILATCHLL